MTAHMQDTAILAYPFHRLHSLLFEYIYLLIQSQGTLGMKDFMKDPGATECGPAYHHCIHPITLKGLLGLLGRGDIAITDDRDADVGMILDLTDEGPVGFARVHLCACAAVQGEGLYATVLQAQVFTVTGVSGTASTTAFVTASSRGTSRSIPLPAPFPATFFTGQPKLMSSTSG